MTRKLFTLAMAAALLCTVGTAQAKKKESPDATIKLSEGSIAAGIGYSWGSGTLRYRGKSYPVSVSGLSVGSVGIDKATATGKVYGLKDLKNFDGVYTAAAAGATAAGGGAAAVMKNQNGVRIDLMSTTQGVSLTLAAEGVSLKLKH